MGDRKAHCLDRLMDILCKAQECAADFDKMESAGVAADSSASAEGFKPPRALIFSQSHSKVKVDA